MQIQWSCNSTTTLLSTLCNARTPQSKLNVETKSCSQGLKDLTTFKDTARCVRDYIQGSKIPTHVILLALKSNPRPSIMKGSKQQRLQQPSTKQRTFNPKHLQRQPQVHILRNTRVKHIQPINSETIPRFIHFEKKTAAATKS